MSRTMSFDGGAFENSGALPGYGPGGAAAAPKQGGEWWKNLPDVRMGGSPPDPDDERRTFLDDVIDNLTGKTAQREKYEKERLEKLDRLNGKNV